MGSFSKAVRVKVPVKAALMGPTNAGKTLGALKLAGGIGGRIALIDTESHRARLYAGKPGVPDFEVCELEPPFSPQRYVEKIREAEAAFDVIVVDSLSHAWAGAGGALEMKDTIAARTGNSYTAWGPVGKAHNDLMETIMRSPRHILCTMRSKMEYAQEKDDRGKTVVKKLGLGPQQRPEIEYEWPVVIEIDREHVAWASKDNTEVFGGATFRIEAEHGRKLREWLDAGAAPIAPEAPAPRPEPVTDDDTGESLMRADAVRQAQAQQGPPPPLPPLRGALVTPKLMTALSTAAKALGYASVGEFAGRPVTSKTLLHEDAENLLARLSNEARRRESGTREVPAA